jgi:hypothetical protein
MDGSLPNIRRILDTDVNRETKIFALQMLPKFEKMWGADNLSVFWDSEENTIEFEYFMDRKNVGGISLYMHDVIDLKK